MQDGLVEVVPQAGTYVARFSIDELKEGAFIREALEVAAIKELANSITDQNLVELRRNLRLQKAYIDDKDIQGFYNLDSQFHCHYIGCNRFQKIVPFIRYRMDECKSSKTLAVASAWKG